MMEQDAAVLEDRPVLSVLIVAAVATLAYVGIQLVIDGRISLPETVGFVVIFTLVYAASIYYLGTAS